MDVITVKGIIIADKKIGPQHPCFIIAEAGVNHNGDVNLAKQLIDIAAEAGADAVKFQTFHAENVVTYTAEKAGYQKNTTPLHESQYEMIKKLELSDDVFFDLSIYAKKKGIIFLSTPFDKESVEKLDRIEIPAFKIPSGEITNFPLLKIIAEKKKPIILSTGMATLGEVEEALYYLKKCGSDDIILLHCTTNYPASLHSVNLCAMSTICCAFKTTVGYSDHTEGITIPIAAVAMGACVLEKHFTLDRSLPGPDHKASLEPSELREMVKAIRDVEIARGSGIKSLNVEESAIKAVVRRSVVARCDITAETKFSENNIAILRPGTGIEPRYYELIINKKARIHIKKNQVLNWDMIE